ncbi:DHH family phosphoesterase [Pseudonocardia humida]|uniref:DHH family phosphoesterase n=1 Tax=Pseudonocardia humida TaxID=2800819 RepID=A0ABT0ZUN8_9PSEU|nr:DHH family phosphoesterase [Pseudonocardia humida]MCO1654450.1 DHH family phosphoesterase [Pseudonocardia humida]
MIPQRPDASAVSDAAALLTTAREVTLLAHLNPDADALGSALALAIALHRRGAAVQVSFATPDEFPETLRPLDALGLVVPSDEVWPAPEVLVSCDAADPGRLGHLADRLVTAGASVMIDHHASNPGFGTVQVLDPQAEATVVLVHEVLVEMGVGLDADIARCLYAGLVTDTRGFRTAGRSAHLLAADLIAAGVHPPDVVGPLMDTHPFSWLAALGEIIAGARLEAAAAGGLGLVHARVPFEISSRFRPAEVDSVIDVVRTAGEAEVAAVFKQVGPQRWVVSLRSNGRVDVAAAAVAMGGGGHPVAAGFTADGPPEVLLGVLRGALSADRPRLVG